VILFPITAFVASGFEHSVANMYFLSIALLIKSFGPAEFWAAAHAVPAQFPHVTLERFLIGNLMPVTLGNTIGGLMVGLMYWGIYCRPNIMMRSNDRGLLAGLTLDGRRRFKRIEADGLVTLHFRGQEFHGKLRNIGEGGASAEFYEARGLPNVGDEMSLDIVLNDVAEQFDAVPAVVMQQREGKNLMGRRYFVFSMMFGELSQRSGDTLKRLVQRAFRAR